MIRGLLVFVLGYLGAMALGMPIAWPYDYPANLGNTPEREDLRAPADGKRRVAVLQHGLVRSSASLGRLARTLSNHGYEVHNLDYRSTLGTLEEHAELLAGTLAQVTAERPVDEWYFAGHSMGGLVIEEYLRRANVPEPTRCVYLAVPHRGAMLADLRKHWFLYRLVMGTKAALQLSPGDPFHQRPIRFLDRSGSIVGDVGEGNGAIPGHDDDTVGVAEATLAGAADTLLVPYSHTRITSHPDVVVQVLAFFKNGRFERR